MTGQTPQNPAGIVILPTARVPNPNVLYGQDDIDVLPSSFPRYSTQDTTQVQLYNGLGNGVAQGFVDGSAPASYLAEVASFEPGTTRLSGTTPGNFPQKPLSPQQWDAYVASTAGSEPTYGGGSGTVIGTVDTGSAGM
jgi:hypothetical protein